LPVAVGPVNSTCFRTLDGIYQIVRQGTDKSKCLVLSIRLCRVGILLLGLPIQLLECVHAEECFLDLLSAVRDLVKVRWRPSIHHNSLGSPGIVLGSS